MFGSMKAMSYLIFSFKNKNSLDILCLLKENDFRVFWGVFVIRIFLNQIDGMLEMRITSALQSSYRSVLLQLIENDFKDCLILCCT